MAQAPQFKPGNTAGLSEQQVLVKRFREWRHDFYGFIRWLFPGVKFTRQQEGALEELGKLISAKLKVADKEKMSEEEERYSKKIGISIMSGNGTGKDFIAAITILGFTLLFPDSKSLCTANTAKQLKNVLWSEISKCMRQLAKKIDGEGNETILEEYMVLQSEKLSMKGEDGATWFTEAVTVNTSLSEEEQAESIAGRHADYQIAVVDEASGIANAVFRKLERTLTRKLNFMFIIFNPTRATGYAIESQTDPRFISMRWNAEESELVCRDHIENMQKKYDKEDNSYRVGVLGLPPKTDDSALFPWEWIENAIQRDVELLPGDPLIKGVDCGGGGDKSIIATRKGHRVYPFKRNTSPDAVVVSNWIGADIDAENPDVVRIDVVGIGHGIEGSVREKKGAVIEAADSRRTADNSEMFYNKRAEMYYNLRELFQRGLISLSLLDEADARTLKFQLGAIKSKLDASGRIQIIEKATIKRQLGHSPDEADALAITCYEPDTRISRMRQNKKKVQRQTLEVV